MKLNGFVKCLTEGKASAKHTFLECGFGANAIREMEDEGYRSYKKPPNTSRDCSGDTESVESSSSGDSSPPSTKKVQMHADYFHPGQFTV